MSFIEVKPTCHYCGQDLPNAKPTAVMVPDVERREVVQVIPIADIRSLCDQFYGEKIRAIKALKDAYPILGLRDAKALIETYNTFK